jgi:hypothetical protein
MGNIGGGSNNEVSYQRDFNGTVHLRGVAQACGNPPGGTIFTLPNGYRPVTQEVQVAMFTSGAKRVDIDPDGSVQAAAANGGSFEWVSLDGLTFRCAPSGANGCP